MVAVARIIMDSFGVGERLGLPRVAVTGAGRWNIEAAVSKDPAGFVYYNIASARHCDAESRTILRMRQWTAKKDVLDFGKEYAARAVNIILR